MFIAHFEFTRALASLTILAHCTFNFGVETKEMFTIRMVLFCMTLSLTGQVEFSSLQSKCKCSGLCRLQFVIFHTNMFEAAPTHGEDCSCILLVTATHFTDDWVGSDPANRCATNIVRKPVSERDQTWEGDHASMHLAAIQPPRQRRMRPAM